MSTIYQYSRNIHNTIINKQEVINNKRKTEQAIQKTYSIPGELLEKVEQLAVKDGFKNRTELIKYAMRLTLQYRCETIRLMTHIDLKKYGKHKIYSIKFNPVFKKKIEKEMLDKKISLRKFLCYSIINYIEEFGLY